MRRWNSSFLSLLCRRRYTQNLLFLFLERTMRTRSSSLEAECIIFFPSLECNFKTFLSQSCVVAGVKKLDPNISHMTISQFWCCLFALHLVCVQVKNLLWLPATPVLAEAFGCLHYFCRATQISERHLLFSMSMFIGYFSLQSLVLCSLFCSIQIIR